MKERAREGKSEGRREDKEGKRRWKRRTFRSAVLSSSSSGPLPIAEEHNFRDVPRIRWCLM